MQVGFKDEQGFHQAHRGVRVGADCVPNVIFFFSELL